MTQHLLVSVSFLALVSATPPASTAGWTGPSAPLVRAAERPNDDTLTSNVLNAIRSDEILRYDLANVQVSVRNGVVTLSGSVRRKTIRQRMELVAHAVKGVSQVVNLLTFESK